MQRRMCFNWGKTRLIYLERFYAEFCDVSETSNLGVVTSGRLFS